jgi:hypothetical protein
MIDDLYLEYACAYIFYYNILLNLKETNQLSEVKKENIEEALKNFTNSKDEAICKKYQITPIVMEQWLQKKRNDE